MKIEIDGYSPKHVSYSALDGYARCGKQYQLSRVLQLEEKPGLAALAGNAIHRASELIDLAEFHGVSIDMLTGLDAKPSDGRSDVQSVLLTKDNQ